MARQEKSERAEKAEKAEKQALANKLHPMPQAHVVHDAARDSALNRAVQQLFEYHRRGFHPNDRDTTELIGQWRTKLFGSDGALTDLLAG